MTKGVYPPWQPIETAPKDGTWILVFGERYMDTELPPFGLSRWVVETEERWIEVNRTTRKLEEQDSSHWDYDTGIEPKYWMPLEPPKVDD